MMKFWRIDEQRSDCNGQPFLLQRGFLRELDAATPGDAVGVWERQHGPPMYRDGYVATEVTRREGDIHI